MGAGVTVPKVSSVQDSALHNPMPKPHHADAPCVCRSISSPPSLPQWHGTAGHCTHSSVARASGIHSLQLGGPWALAYLLTGTWSLLALVGFKHSLVHLRPVWINWQLFALLKDAAQVPLVLHALSLLSSDCEGTARYFALGTPFLSEHPIF